MPSCLPLDDVVEVEVRPEGWPSARGLLGSGNIFELGDEAALEVQSLVDVFIEEGVFLAWRGLDLVVDAVAFLTCFGLRLDAEGNLLLL